MNSVPTDRPSQPNILFILSDDQGYFDVGYQGSEILTPNIDQLAKDGVKLENYYVTQGQSYYILFGLTFLFQTKCILITVRRHTVCTSYKLSRLHANTGTFDDGSVYDAIWDAKRCYSTISTSRCSTHRKTNARSPQEMWV